MTIKLFTSPNCVACPLQKAILDDMGINYTTINAWEQPENTNFFKVKELPCIIVVDSFGFIVHKFSGLTNKTDLAILLTL